MRDTPWLTGVPAAWSVDQTRRHFDFRKELNSERKEPQVLSLTLRGVVQNDPENPEGLVPSDYSTYQVFDAGDLVFKLIDLENLRTSRVGLVPERGIMSSAYIRLVPRPDVDSRFSYWYFYSLWVRNVYNQLGGGVRATLGSADLLGIPIAVPPLEEQRRIADFLDDQVGRIDTLLKIRGERIALLKERKRASITAHVTGTAGWTNLHREKHQNRKEDPGTTRRASAMSLEGAVATLGNPAEWPEISLRKLVWQKKDTGHPELELLGVSVAVGVRPRWQGDNRPAASLDLNGYKRVRPGEIVMNALGKPHGSIGRSAQEGITSPAYWVLECTEHADSRFLHYLLRSSHMVNEYQRIGKYLPPNQFDISWDLFRNITVPLPPLEEQRRIADFLDDVEESFGLRVNLENQGIRLLEERKRALITAAVTGELDVTMAKPINVGANR